MSASPSSLLTVSAARLAAAPFLFSEMEMDLEYIGEPTMQGHYSGERLFSERPDVYQEVVNMLSQGSSVRSIKLRCKVHHNTIEAVRQREGEAIDTLRKRMARKCFSLGNMLIESLEEDVMAGRLKPGEKAFAAGMSIDKGQVLSGGVTERVERVIAPDKDAVRDYLESLPAMNVEEMGSEAREKSAMPTTMLPQPSVIDVITTPELQTNVDRKSLV